MTLGNGVVRKIGFTPLLTSPEKQHFSTFSILGLEYLITSQLRMLPVSLRTLLWF